MGKKVNPFEIKSKEIEVAGIKLSITLPTAKEYMNISKQTEDNLELSLLLIENCVRYEGDKLDVESLPVDVFGELSEKVIKTINPDFDPDNPEKK